MNGIKKLKRKFYFKKMSIFTQSLKNTHFEHRDIPRHKPINVKKNRFVSFI